MTALGGQLALAQELDVASHRDQADPIIGLLPADAEQTLAVAEGECLDADAHKLGREKVPELVDEDEDPEDDEKGQQRAEEISHITPFPR